MKNFCVLIPSYNEAKMIGHIVRALKREALTVYVVDDGSTDDTGSIARREGAEVIVHETNKGKGASLIDGFKYVLERGFDACLVMDGDGQHKVEDIPNFIKCGDETGADMVVGNRMHDTSSMPFVRKKTNQIMSNLISRISGQYVPDTQCGFRLIKKDALEKLNLESSNFEIESELIIKAARLHFKIASVPITTVYQDEKSRINPIIDTLRFIALIVKTAKRK